MTQLNITAPPNKAKKREYNLKDKKRPTNKDVLLNNSY